MVSCRGIGASRSWFLSKGFESGGGNALELLQREEQERYGSICTVGCGDVRSHGMATTVEVRVEELKVESNYWETTCWGCKLQLTLPRFSPIFKCGFCGAVAIHKTNHKHQSRWNLRFGSILDHCLVTLTCVLAILIVYGGVWTMFPILFPSPSFGLFFHSAITAVLAFNTVFNFVFAAFIPAGPPPPVEWGQFEMVDRGGLENYKFCAHCQKPKPPAAHHCRTCRTCVMEMDHHCPFIGNCVGANNHGYFILFLIFTILSCLYILCMVVYTYNHSRMSLTVIQYDPPEPGTSGIGLDYMADVLSSLLFDNQVAFTIRYIGLLYLFVVSVALLIGVGFLLYQQLSLVYQGQTCLDTLSTGVNDSNSGSGKIGWANLQRVFGKRYPWLWLFPYLSSKKFHAR